MPSIASLSPKRRPMKGYDSLMDSITSQWNGSNNFRACRGHSEDSQLRCLDASMIATLESSQTASTTILRSETRGLRFMGPIVPFTMVICSLVIHASGKQYRTAVAFAKRSLREPSKEQCLARHTLDGLGKAIHSSTACTIHSKIY